MAPLDPDDPCYDIFLCDTTLDCETHLEPEFFVSRIEPTRLELCCHCAGVSKSPIELNTSLTAPEGPYSVVLPICMACLDSGCNIIVRSARQNAKAKHARLEAENARKLLEQDVDADVGAEAEEEDKEEQPTSLNRMHNAEDLSKKAHYHQKVWIICEFPLLVYYAP